MAETSYAVITSNFPLNLSQFWKILVLSAVVFVFLKYSFWRRKFSKILPGRKFNFFHPFGNLLEIPFRTSQRNGYPAVVYIVQYVGSYARLFRKHKIYCLWFSYAPMVAAIKAEAVEAVLKDTKLMEKAWLYSLLHPWLGTGLLTSHGAKWKSRRKLLTPSFHFDILKDFLPIFNNQAQVLVKKLRKGIDNEFTDITNPITLCSLDIICETTLGVKIGAQENNESKYVKAVSRISETITNRGLRVWLWADFIFRWTKMGRDFNEDIKLLHGFTRALIQKKKKELLESGVRDDGKRKRKALMDVLLEHHVQKKDFTEEDIREEVDTFAFEGHDTTSMGMVWALYLIGLYPEVQQKVHEELDDIFGDDTERHVTTEDLNDMKYLDLVLKESQRLYPSVPFFGRQVNEDTELCGYVIPKGTQIAVLTHELHRDEEVFPNPEKFDPDRFLPENSMNRSPYAYVPFSAGPRNCIGQRFAVMEEKVVVSTVLRSYNLKSLDHRDKLPAITELILRAFGPIRVCITSRKQ